MKNKIFKPLLSPNKEVDLFEISYPVLASYKLDGIRVIFKNGEILTRSLKQLPNKQLRDKFEPIRKYSEENNCILDGEIYSPKLTFQEIISFCMTQDFEDKKSIRKFGTVLEIPEHLNFYCFDCIVNEDFTKPFKRRCEDLDILHFNEIDNIFHKVKHEICNNPKTIEYIFNDAIEAGCEGLILRDREGRYKFGRGTIKEGIIYKLKPYVTEDGKILGVVQSTEVKSTAEKKTNELGRSVTSKKKNDRVLINKASAFWVEYYNEDTKQTHELKVVLAMTDEEKEHIWKNKDSYIGKWIEYKGMKIGSKDVLRHPVMVRFREPKE